MRLDQPFKNLGPVESFAALKQSVLSLDDLAWNQDQSRQEIFSNVHGSTQTLVLLFCDGWPSVDVQARSAWAILGPVATAAMKEVVSRTYVGGGAVIRAMVARLPAGCSIARHYDAHPSFAAAHRIHIPIATHDDVNFVIDDVNVRFEEGTAYEIDNLRMHEVHNRSHMDRLHFIFDYAEPAQLAESQT